MAMELGFTIFNTAIIIAAAGLGLYMALLIIKSLTTVQKQDSNHLQAGVSLRK